MVKKILLVIILLPFLILALSPKKALLYQWEKQLETRGIKLADGVIRLEYVAGTRVYEEAKRLEEILEHAAEKASSQPVDLPRRVENLVSDNRTLRRVISEYRRVYVESLSRSSRRIGPVRLVVFRAFERDARDVQEILKKLTTEPDMIAVAVTESDGAAILYIAAGRGSAGKVSAAEIAGKLSSRLNGKGGGGRTFATLRVSGGIGVEEIWEAMEEILSRIAG